jgi:hypothetical protein
MQWVNKFLFKIVEKKANFITFEGLVKIFNELIFLISFRIVVKFLFAILIIFRVIVNNPFDNPTDVKNR